MSFSENIFEFANTNNIKNIEVCFVDMLGKSRVVVIPKSRLKVALKNGLKCDGSSVCFNKTTNNSDLNLVLDENSFYLLPNQNLLVFASTNSKFDARKKLKNLEKKFERENMKICVGAELEFFMFENNAKDFGKQNKNCQSVQQYKLDSLSYFENDDGRCFDVLNSLVDFCDGKNIDIEAFHHECGKSQFEIDYKFDSPSKTADRVVYLKRLLSIFAQKNNLTVSFLPKPFKDECGSGMHTNISVFSGGENLFYQKSDANKLSSFAYNFANGIFRHIKPICAFANPSNNSYDRLFAGSEVPQKVNLSKSDRTALIRIPKFTKNGARLEFRLPDISCNPYSTFLAVLMAGFENINFSENISMQIANQKNQNISIEKFENDKNTEIPKNLDEAKLALKQDKLLSGARYVY